MDKVVQAATELLARAGAKTLPVDVMAVAREIGCVAQSVSKSKELLQKEKLDISAISDGRALQSGGRSYILYNDELTDAQRDRVIAHELGHLVLHQDPTSPYLTGARDRNKQEAEAEKFARNLLAPLPALYVCNVRSPEEIRNLVGLSASDCDIISFDLQSYITERRGMEISQEVQRQYRGIKIRLYLRKHRYAVVMTTIMTVIIAALTAVSALSLSSINRLQAQIEGQSAIPTTTPTTQKYSSATDPGADPIANISAETTTTTTGEEQIVYITREGDKYHDADCRYVAGREDAMVMTEAEAQRAGYEACAVCGG